MSEHKPKGHFDYLLAMDCETTGLCINNHTPVENNDGERHQAVSWGFVVADAQTLMPQKELYVEIKWNKYSKEQRKLDSYFGIHAEKIHGLTKEYLDDNGMTETEAVERIANEIIVPYWGIGANMSNIRTLGHNVHTFDLPFLRDLFGRHGLDLPFGNRHMDSNSLGFGTVGSLNSDDLFSVLGMDDRDEHNALEDARMALESFRLVRVLWKGKVGINAY